MSIPSNPLPPGISGSTPRRSYVDPATNMTTITEYLERPRRSRSQREADAEALADFERAQAEHAAQKAAAAARLAAADEEEHAAIFEAARVLGAKVEEILDVRTTELGVEVCTVGAGPVVVLVSPEAPDADGRSGVMLHPDTPAWQAGDVLPVYARTLSVPEAPPEPIVEPEPAREPWQDALDQDARLQALLSEVAEIDASLAAMREQDRHSGNGQALRDARASVVDLARMRTAKVRGDWHTEHPEPPDPREVKFWCDLYVAGTLFDQARSDFERRTVFAAFPTAQLYLNGRTSAASEAAGAVHWLKGNGVPLPEVPTIEDLEVPGAAIAPRRTVATPVAEPAPADGAPVVGAPEHVREVDTPSGVPSPPSPLTGRVEP